MSNGSGAVDRPRHVLLLTRTLGHGGTERQLSETALSIDRRVFEPHVCCVDATGARADQLRRGGVPILELPMNSLTSRETLAGLIRLRRYIAANRIRLLHTFDVPMNILGAMMGLLAGPVVLSSQRCYENVIWPPYRLPNRIAHSRADGVVVNCQAMCDHVLHDYKVPARGIHVCPNGLDTSVFYPGTRAKPNLLRDADFVIGCVCVLRPEKSLGTLLQAFSMVRHDRPGMKLVLVGSGPELEPLRKLSTELGIDGQCLFCPATDDVPSWLRALDIFVLPSVSEAFSNSLMEAMACGCCAIASNVGGNPELVRHGETGLLFDCGSAAGLARNLRLTLADDALRSRLATAGSEWVSVNLSQAAAARKMEEIYLQNLGEH
jgi:glycosyltransferase involved in cell wall biosynthesis